jgi:hypothetical protein
MNFIYHRVRRHVRTAGKVKNWVMSDESVSASDSEWQRDEMGIPQRLKPLVFWAVETQGDRKLSMGYQPWGA